MKNCYFYIILFIKISIYIKLLFTIDIDKSYITKYPHLTTPVACIGNYTSYAQTNFLNYTILLN